MANIPPKEKLKAMYWDYRMSLQKIGRWYGVGRDTVLSWFKHYGIPRRDVRQSHLGYVEPQEQRVKVSEGLKRAYAEGRRINPLEKPGALEKMAETRRKQANTPEGKARHLARILPGAHGLKWRENVRRAMRKRYENPEARRRTGEAGRRWWGNAPPEVVRARMYKILTKSGEKPNSTEQCLDRLLGECMPGEWLYNGKAKHLTIERKVPDWINVNGKKELIEVWGDYYHRGQNPEDRVAIFGRYGYSTLVIWAHELKNPDALREKVLSFGNR